ncbi:hypothetical protein ABPG72_015340 [Tetrahymena utriculariae]
MGISLSQLEEELFQQIQMDLKFQVTSTQKGMQIHKTTQKYTKAPSQENYRKSAIQAQKCSFVYLNGVSFLVVNCAYDKQRDDKKTNNLITFQDLNQPPNQAKPIKGNQEMQMSNDAKSIKIDEEEEEEEEKTINSVVNGHFDDNNTNGELKLLQKGCQTRRVFIKGSNISEFVLILKKRLQVKKSIIIEGGGYGCIYFKNPVKSSTIFSILENSSLNLELYSSKRAKGTFDSFFPSPSELSSSFQSSKSSQNKKIAATWMHNTNTNSSSLVSANTEQIKQLLENQAKQQLEKQKELIGGLLKQQQQQQGHQCSSKDCCLTLLEMIKNSNIKQLLGHMCKVVVKNGWCVHQLFNYVDHEVQDVKLNEQIFQIISEKMNDIKNACELGGNLNICKNCQEQRKQQQYFLCQNNLIQQNNIKQQIQPNEVMQQSSEYINGIQFFSFVRQEDLLEQPQVQECIVVEKQQVAQQFHNNPRRQESHQQHLKQVQDDSIKKHVSMQEVARSRSQSPITKSINKKQ